MADLHGMSAPEGAMRVGRALGIPIYVHPSLLIVFALVSWTLATGYFPQRDPGLSAEGAWLRAVIASVLFFASILLHELGHSVVARRVGVPIESITLFIFGGVARMARDPESGKAELRIAAAGPAVSLLLAGVFHLLRGASFVGDAGRDVAGHLAGINLAVAIFNLVPAFPLDGGRLLRGLLWPAAGKLRATRAATLAGTAFATLLVAFGAYALVAGHALAGIWYVLVGWFLRDAAGGALKQARVEAALEGALVRDALQAPPVTVPGWISVTGALRERWQAGGGGEAWPVLRGDQVVGVLHAADVLRVPPDERETTSVQAVMRPLQEGQVVDPDAGLLPVLPGIVSAPGRTLLIVREGRLLGVLTAASVGRLVGRRASGADQPGPGMAGAAVRPGA